MGNTRGMISDGNSSFRCQNVSRVENEWTGPTSYERTSECARLVIGFECIVD